MQAHAKTTVIRNKEIYKTIQNTKTNEETNLSFKKYLIRTI
jgi:hypothetical protein